MYLGTNGHFDDVPIEDTARFNSELLENMRHKHEDVLTEIRETGKWSDELAEKVAAAATEFKKGFTTSEGKQLNEVEADAMDAEHVGQESVKVNRPAPKK